MNLILGSQSPSRRLALESTGRDFEVMPANIDEKAIRSDDFRELPLLIARAKASALITRLSTEAILITADQVVEYAGELREEPESSEQARSFLTSYNYDIEPAQTNSAVVVTNTKTGEQAEGIDIAKTYFRPIPLFVVEELVKDQSILESAGAFIIEHPLMKHYIDHIEGTADSVMGLPLELTFDLIDQVS